MTKHPELRTALIHIQWRVPPEMTPRLSCFDFSFVVMGKWGIGHVPTIQSEFTRGYIMVWARNRRLVFPPYERMKRDLT